MKRIAETRLEAWFSASHRKPLLLRGARQVGKSTLVQTFARAKGLTLNEVNLERHRDLAPVFATMDPGAVCSRVGAILGRDVRAADSLLFIDEIQAVPEAIAALRYFREEMPGLPVLAAGSLLEFTRAKHTFSMPVGRVEYLHLGPADFAEFAAEVNPFLASKLDLEIIRSEEGRTIHPEMMRLLRTYLLVGGMPECVQRYSDTRAVSEASSVHEQILGTYIDDFAKYANGRDLAQMQAVFRRIPGNVAKKAKFANFDRDAKSRDVKAVLDLFAKARIMTKVTHSDATGVPLGGCEDPAVWKPLFLDVGLLLHACGIGEADVSALTDERLVNEGMLAEQFVGQHLLYRGGCSVEPNLHYWLRDGAKNNAEVDFVVSAGSEIVPVEVKAGKAGTLRALRRMVEEKGLRRAIRFGAGVASVQNVPLGDGKSYRLETLPLYAAACRGFESAMPS